MTDDEPTDRQAAIRDDPFCDLLGIQLAGLEPGHAVARLRTSTELANFHGTAHGGAIYALADAAFAAAANADDDAVALETNISYLAGVEPGTVLTAHAEETHRSASTGEYEVVVTDDDGNRVATFRGRAYRR